MKVLSQNSVNCPHCGRLNPSDENNCQSCSKNLTIYIGPSRSLPRRLGLGTLMILVAVIAIGFGIFRIIPVLGGLYLLLFTPAMIRTLGVASQRKIDEQPMSFEELIYVFLGSLGLMIVTVVASWMTMLLICLPISSNLGSNNSYGYILAQIVSGTVGLFVGCIVLIRYWNYRH